MSSEVVSASTGLTSATPAFFTNNKSIISSESRSSGRLHIRPDWDDVGTSIIDFFGGDLENFFVRTGVFLATLVGVTGAERIAAFRPTAAELQLSLES